MHLSNFYTKYSVYIHVFAFFWAIFALTNSGMDSSEGDYHYQVAVQIIKHHRLSFDTLPSGIFTTAPNGLSYASHEIGNTLFMLPTALVNTVLESILSNKVNPERIQRIQSFIFSFQSGFCSACTLTVLFYLLHKVFLKNYFISFFSCFSLAFTTFFWTYSRNAFDGVFCSLLLSSGITLIFQYRRQQRSTPFLLSGFAFLGLALITRLSMLLAIFSAIIYLLVSYRRSAIGIFQELLLVTASLIPFVIWQAYYNNLRTGIFYKSPVQLPIYESNALDGNLITGLTGLILSPGKGIFIYAPLSILTLVIFRSFSRRYPKESIFIATFTVLWFLLHARLRSWYGAWGWGPRHVITILPFLLLPLAASFEVIWKTRGLRWSATILGGFGFLLAISSMISNWHFRMAYLDEQGLLSDSTFVWSLSENQAIDMLKSTVGNIIRVLIDAAPLVIRDSYSPANEYASSTINFWPNSLLYAGFPGYIVAILILPLLTTAFFSGKAILSRCYQEPLDNAQIQVLAISQKQ